MAEIITLNIWVGQGLSKTKLSGAENVTTTVWAYSIPSFVKLSEKPLIPAGATN